MRKMMTFASVAILAGGSVALLPTGAWAADQPQRSANAQDEKQANLALPPGFTAKDINKDSIRSELASVTEDALTADKFDDVVNQLVAQDRTRIGDYKNRHEADLNKKINTIRQMWKDKYGKDFEIKKEKDLYQPQSVAILTGEVSDSAQAVQHWPVDPWTGKPMEKSKDEIAAAAHEAGKTFGGKTDLDKGRNVALVRIAESHGLPAITLSMIHELPDHWRFDIPNSRNGDQIYSDLSTQLDYMIAHGSEWPNNLSDGYAMVSHRVLTALYGSEQNTNNQREPAKG